ncbi:MAG: glycosyltransferase family 4 protein [Trueperaceae bacterium]
MQFPAPSETFASNDVRWLRECGLTVSVHAMREPHAFAKDLIAERRLRGVEITHNSLAATSAGLATALRRPLRLVSAIGWLVRHNHRRPDQLARSLLLLPRAFGILDRIRRERPDVVHVYWAHYPAIVGHLVQRYLPDVATSISFVAYDLEMEYGGGMDVARNADTVRTLAETNVGHVASLAGIERSRVEIVYDGVDVEKLEAIVAGRRKVPGRMVTVGRLTEAKGMYEAIDVLARVRRKWPTATLRVLGDGPEAAGLKARAAALGVDGAVEFLGHVSHERVVEELAEAEVFLLLTKASGERLPNVVKEGMACRCVCVTTPTPGIEELVVDGVNGFVVPAGDVHNAVEIVQRVLSGQVETQSLIDAAHRQVVSNFDLDASGARYLELWRRAVRRRRGTSHELPESQQSLATS